mgnify:CR=1 FL=1
MRYSKLQSIECPHCGKKLDGYTGDPVTVGCEFRCPHCNGMMRVEDVDYECWVYVKPVEDAQDDR